MQYQQAYFTTSYAVDDSGNYYFPVFIPDNVTVTMPLTTIKPDSMLGNHGLIFDWETRTWRTSDRDPMVQELDKLKQQVQEQTTLQLNSMKNILDNVAKQDKTKNEEQSVSAKSSSANEATNSANSTATSSASSATSQAKEATK